MQHLVSIPPVGRPRDLVDLAIAAEASGWDGVFLWDHLHLVRALHADVVDPWVVLGAMAGATERVRLGPLVTPLPRRRPWVVAKELVTLDHLSAGRAVLGVGIGFPADDEFGAFGEPTGDRERADLLDEGLGLVDALVRGEPVSHHGAHFDVEAQFRPASVQRPRPPVWVAAMTPARRPLARAARWDGVAPISADGLPMLPAAVAAYLDGVPRRPGFDIVTGGLPGVPVDEYAGAGVTWLVESRWPEGDWFADLSRSVRAGPPG